jgi:hypothetical protein
LLNRANLRLPNATWNRDIRRRRSDATGRQIPQFNSDCDYILVNRLEEGQ